MKIFVVHSGSDWDRAVEIKEEIQDSEDRAHVVILDNKRRFWKREARKLIQQADMVLFIVGEKSHTSSNIDWELARALKHEKPILVHPLESSNEVNECLYESDRFLQEPVLRAQRAESVDGVIQRVKSYAYPDYQVLNQTEGELDREAFLAQYKAFLETSENLVDRRQLVNSFYLSANAAILAAAAAIGATLSEANERAALAFIIGIIGLAFSMSWYQVIESYGIVNSSKMSIISMLEESMPASLFSTEWEVMTHKDRAHNYVSFTESEKRAALLFGSLYVIAILLSLFFIVPMVIGWLNDLIAGLF